MTEVASFWVREDTLEADLNGGVENKRFLREKQASLTKVTKCSWRSGCPGQNKLTRPS
jgi:hypothetical protein